jgi:hypothetical protein
MAALGLSALAGLCCGGLFGWGWLSVSEPVPKSAITLAGTRWILDRNGPSTCVTLEYRAQPLREAPGLQHRTFTLDWPLNAADDDPLMQIDVATLIGHISLRQHTLCWS